MDLIGMLPDFGNLFFTLAVFVVVLSVIVAVHEYGHYIVGRWSGIHADVFSIGFGPVLTSWVDRRGTRWQMAAIPLGGFVKFAGDADAASSPDSDAVAAMDDAARRRTMAGAPLWARAATVAAGPVFNFAFSFFVFAAVVMFGGVASDEPLVGELTPLPVSYELAPGDRILAVEGQETPQLGDILALIDTLPREPVLTYTVERAGQRMDVTGPHPQPPLAGSVSMRSAARDAQMESGDVITHIDGAPIATFEELRERVGASDGKPLDLRVWRAGEEIALTLTPRRTDLPLPEGGFETRYLIGLTSGAVFDYATRTPGLIEAAEISGQNIWRVVRTSLEGMYYMIVGAISTCNMSSPIGIAEASASMASDGLRDLVWFVAVISVAIGLLNLFPIPPLDGGHLVFYTFEAVTGRPPSDRALRVLMALGLTLVMSVFAFAIFNDLTC